MTSTPTEIVLTVEDESAAESHTWLYIVPVKATP
jgi:hypothetical protein